MHMMKNNYSIITGLLLATLVGCDSSNDRADGYGNFEATEITISAESNGKLLSFAVNEGQQLTQGQVLGVIDTIQLSLKKDQLKASKSTIYSKSQNVMSQRAVLLEQLSVAQKDQTRIGALVKDQAATQKQLDDINGQMSILKQRIRSVETQNAPIINEMKSLDVQLKLLDDQIEKSIVRNPIKGTVLVKYTEPGEITAFGKPLYKIANLDEMTLRVYVSENQLANIKIGQEVTVKIDDTDIMKSYTGTISWIASQAEFTPKIIQTKEERVNLVYAVKIIVKNDGSLKIGMPAEMMLSNDNNQ